MKELLELIKKGRDTMKSSKKNSEDFKDGYDLCATSVIEVIEEQSTQSDLSKIKVDDNGKVLDEPIQCGDCDGVSKPMPLNCGNCWGTDYAIEYQNAKYLPEWIEAKNKRVEMLRKTTPKEVVELVDDYYKSLDKLQQANEQIQKLKEFLTDTSNKIGRGRLNLGDFQVEIKKQINK